MAPRGWRRRHAEPERALWWTFGRPRLIGVHVPPDWCLFCQKGPIIPGRLDRAKNMPFFPRKNGVSDKLRAVGPIGSSGHSSPDGGRADGDGAPAAWPALAAETSPSSSGGLRRADHHLGRGRGSKVSCGTGRSTWATRATTRTGSRRASGIPAGRIMDETPRLGKMICRAAGVLQQDSPKGRRGCETRLQQPFLRAHFSAKIAKKGVCGENRWRYNQAGSSFGDARPSRRMARAAGVGQCGATVCSAA
jgi:hypothetical protein